MTQMLIKVWQEQFQDLSVGMLFSSFLFLAVLLHIIIQIRNHTVGKRRTGVKRELLYMLLLFSYCLLFQVTIWCREMGSRDGVALIPFTKVLTSKGTPNYRLICYAVLNVILFIPFGTLWTFILRSKSLLKKNLLVFLYGFSTSALIEVIQYVTKRGYFEIEDILCNTVGALIGFLIAALCCTVDKNIRKRG